MKKSFGVILFFLLYAVLSYAQQIDERIETMLLEEEETTEGIAFKPILGFGAGMLSFYGDVENYLSNPLNGLPSARISISRNFSNKYDLEFHGTFGSVSSSQYDGYSNHKRNFRTSIFQGGVSLFYNFNHILKRKRPIHPYISIGAEVMQFMPRGDLYDEYGNQYHYWSDGTIRDVEEGIGQAGELIGRDYEYETNLRTDSEYGYYSRTTFAFPIDVGFNVTVSDRVTCRVGGACHIATTDYIDNYKGRNNLGFDIVLNTYVALTFDLFSSADEIASVENFKNLRFTVTDHVDEDKDGVDDFNDECPETPKGVEITQKGCPKDNDKDGVPDYIDKEGDTPVGAIVGANGVRMMDMHLIVLLYDPEAIRRSDVKLYNKKTKASQLEDSKGIPVKFKHVDINNDNYISHDELQKAIDALFEGNSKLTPAEIEELQDFFFNQ